MNPPEVTEIEYHELYSDSNRFQHYRLGLRVKTTPETYQQDLASVIAEVKTKLNEIARLHHKQANSEKTKNQKEPQKGA